MPDYSSAMVAKESPFLKANGQLEKCIAEIRQQVQDLRNRLAPFLSQQPCSKCEHAAPIGSSQMSELFAKHLNQATDIIQDLRELMNSLEV